MTASHPQYFIVIDSISPHSNSQLLTAIHCDEPNTGFEPRLISAHFFCPLVWLAVTLKLAHFFISEVAQVFIRNRTLDFTNAEDVFLRSIKNLQ